MTAELTDDEIHNFDVAEMAAGQGHWNEACYYLLINIHNRLRELPQ